MRIPLFCNITILSIVVLSLGCSALRPSISDELQRSFEGMVVVTSMNTDLKAKLIGAERQTPGADIKIRIENAGQSPISLSTDVNNPFVKIFAIRNNQWIELGNDVTYSSIRAGGNIVLDIENGKEPNEFTVLVRPIIEIDSVEGNRTELIRILFIGKATYNDNNSDAAVGAYIDLEVER